MGKIIVASILAAFLAVASASAAVGPALVSVSSPRPGVVEALLAADVMVVDNTPGRLLVVVPLADTGKLDALGLAWQLLDADITGKTYYTTSLARDDQRSAIASRASVLTPTGPDVVFEATPDGAVRIAGEGFEIARVFLRPVRVAKRAKPGPRRSAALGPDPMIQAMVDSISGPRIDATVQRLQDFVTRYANHDSCLAAANYIKSSFQSSGIDSVYFHDWSPLYYDNVVGVMPGVGNPQKIVVIGGHYDSVTGNHSNCPGADDNASGTTCVLECARVLGNYRFDYTVTFIAFCGEELGLLGSEAYASEAAARGDDIIAMIDVDMIGYVAPGDAMDLDIIDNFSSQWLRDRVMNVGALYVPGLSLVDGHLPGTASSDHVPFWNHGYDAIMFFEDSGNHTPYIHTTNDLVGPSYNAPLLAEGSVKVAAALVADLAVPFRVAVNHTPLAHTEDNQNPYRVAARLFAAGTLNPDSLLVRYATTSGVRSLTMVPTGAAAEFEAFIPPQPGGTIVEYFIVAEDLTGNRTVHPTAAPAEKHWFIVGLPTTVVADDFETDSGWTVGASGDDATSGIWERVDPNGTRTITAQVQPEDDHTPAPGVTCFVTGNANPGAGPAFNDVDDGKTTLSSPVYDLSALGNAWVRYYRWYTNDTGGNTGSDEWVVDVSADSGASWVRMETVLLSERSWYPVEKNISDFVPLSDGVQFRFVAADYGLASQVEAGIDDFSITTYVNVATALDRPPTAPVVALAQNFPNPFNPATTIRFNVPEPGARATLKIYDVTGREVATLLDREWVVGRRAVRWDGIDRRGAPVATGIYFYRLQAAGRTISRKLAVIH
ncbi:MAG: M28 family peptidase [Candidatus Krumholzibacteriia bacterium]